MFRAFRTRSAFTLVEMLVVVAIIGMLMVLLLPAIQSARESARNTQCKNNLKQIGLAFNEYATAHGGFPNRHGLPGSTALTGGYGWGLQMLPYMERDWLYNKFDFTKSWFDPENQPVTMTAVPPYMCPTASPTKRVMDLARSSPTTTTSTGIPGDYVVFHQLSFTGSGSTCTNCTTAAPQTVNGVTRPNDIKDGLSTTILLSEQAGRPVYYIGRQAQASNTAMTNPKFWGCWAAYQSVTAQGWNAAATPAAGGVFSMNRSNSQGVYSFHTESANFVMCDSSVRAIDEKTPISVILALSTKDGSESVAGY